MLKRLIFAGMLVPGHFVEWVYEDWAADGRPTITLPVPNYGLLHLRETLQAVIKRLVAILQPGDDVELVGHSMGGFVAYGVAMVICLSDARLDSLFKALFGRGYRSDLKFEGFLDDVERLRSMNIRVWQVKSVGTPWHGADAAHPSWSPPRELVMALLWQIPVIPASLFLLKGKLVKWPFAGTRCMVPGSRVLETLRLGVEMLSKAKNGPSLFTYRTEHDGLMDRDSPVLEPAKNQFIPGGWSLNHFTQPKSRRLIAQLNLDAEPAIVEVLDRQAAKGTTALTYYTTDPVSPSKPKPRRPRGTRAKVAHAA